MGRHGCESEEDDKLGVNFERKFCVDLFHSVDALIMMESREKISQVKSDCLFNIDCSDIRSDVCPLSYNKPTYWY